jgi:FkbM family methyltransferase
VSKRLGRVSAGIVIAVTAAQKEWRRAATRLAAIDRLLPRHRVVTRWGPLVFTSEHAEALQYPREFERLEPETLAWIDGFEVPCRFWDVGANIGVFSLYAGLRRGVEVSAFEPAAASYAALCRNIETNRLDDRVKAYCLALCDGERIASLNLSASNAGSVFNAFDSDEDCFGRPIAAVFRQGMLGFSIDGLCRQFGLPAPNYLKIDVDGIEERILAGARHTLADPRLRSVLLELEAQETPRNLRLVAALEAAGFHLAARGPHSRGGSRNGIFERC